MQYIQDVKDIDTGSAHISLDLWTSIQMQAVLGIRLHYINKRWELVGSTIGFKHFDQAANSVNVRNYFKDFLTKTYGASPKQVPSYI